jgi:hypothetical protein
MRVLLGPALLVASCFGQAYGTWKMDAARSTFTGDTRPKSLALRIEHHSKGEVFTLDRVEKDGQTTTSSIVLYFDGVARDFQQAECSGTQSSRRIDSQTVEIVRNCGAGAWTRFVRRTTPKSELILEISEQRADGRRFGRRLVFEKQ